MSMTYFSSGFFLYLSARYSNIEFSFIIGSELSRMSEILSCISSLPSSPAKHLGKKVFPVPGMPTRNMPLALNPYFSASTSSLVYFFSAFAPPTLASVKGDLITLNPSASSKTFLSSYSRSFCCEVRSP